MAGTQVIGPEKGKHIAFFNYMADDELKNAWLTKMKNTENYHYRDTLVDRMMNKGIEPTEWMRDRNTSYGLYPDVEDPAFAARLYKKTEFASLSSRAVDEDVCNKSSTLFEKTAVQQLVARFLHPSTPYHGLLLNHGVGVGKTCSAITVAEMFLEIMPHNTVYILAPQAIADGFKKTIFNVQSLVQTEQSEYELTGDRWKSPQCTGMTYLRLTDNAGSEDKEKIEKEVSKTIRKRYKIMGYLAFANEIQALMDTIPQHIVGTARDDIINSRLISMFADHLFIIDEAHNLRDSTAKDAPTNEIDNQATKESAEGRKLTGVLRRIFTVCEGLRCMFMTATPMYNTAPEIIYLLNLLLLNDTKDRSKEIIMSDVFRNNGEFTENGETILAKYIKRYVSYMRGENPDSFPLRLTPPESGGTEFMNTYPEISISRSEGNVSLSDTDKRIMGTLPLVIHNVGTTTFVGNILTQKLKEHARVQSNSVSSSDDDNNGGTEIGDLILNDTMELGNCVYPNGMFGRNGWGQHFEKHVSNGIAQFEWKGENPIESMFGSDGLVNYAPKIGAIVKSLQRSQGMSFVFSRYVTSGALPIAIALELAGWCRVLHDGTPAPLLKRTGAPKPKYYYILLTSNPEYSSDFAKAVDYARNITKDQALNGTKVKTIIGSQVASEGLDLKCIRELHLLDGWYHLNRIEQIEGRGVRFCSHSLLDLQYRNCLIYLHALNVSKYETADLYSYRLAVRKSQPIGRVTRLMKIHAWDCMMNHDAILLTDLGTRRIVDAQGRIIEEYDLADKPYTSFCDFSEKCEYECAGGRLKKEDIGSNKSTYQEFDFRQTFLEKQAILANLYGNEMVVAEHIGIIRDTVFEDMPWSMAMIGLRNILGKIRIRRNDGIVGTLILKNNYLLFQPIDVTDYNIPLAYRYGRAYGKLPRIIQPDRGVIMKSDMPMADTIVPIATQPSATVATDISTNNLYTKAITSLATWATIVNNIVNNPLQKMDPPGEFSKEGFQGWHWVLYHFRNLPETRMIAVRWWMDNLWSTEERIAVLSSWVTRWNDLNAEEKELAQLYMPRELFYSPALKGFQVFDTKDLKIKQYCMTATDSTPVLCSSLFIEEVDKFIGPRVDRVGNTDDVHGFLVTKKGVVVFKTLHKPSAEGSLLGAECANTSTLSNHYPRIYSAMNALIQYAPTDPINTYILSHDKEKEPDKPTKDARQKILTDILNGKQGNTFIDFDNIFYLSLRQLCPYMEFVLRYMEMKKIGGKRWFLSLVDSARSLPSGKQALKLT